MTEKNNNPGNQAAETPAEDVKTEEVSAETTPAEKTAPASSEAKVTATEEPVKEKEAEQVEVKRVERKDEKVTFGDEDSEIVLIDTSKFSDEEVAIAQERAEGLDFGDTNAVQLFGSDPQRKLNGFLNNLLGDIKVGEAGPMGDMTIALSKGIDEVKLDKFQNQMENGRSFIAKLPLIGDWFDYARIFLAKQQSFSTLIEGIEKKAQGRKEKLQHRNIQLDKLYEQNEEAQVEMALWIYSGEKALAIGKNLFEEQHAAAQISKDPQEAARVNDLKEQITTFEVRLADMKTAYMRAMVSGPQIRTVQSAGKIEMQNITRSLLNDLPALKQAIVMAAANYSIIQAQAEREGRTAALRKIEEANVKATGTAYIKSKESQGNSLDDAKHIAKLARETVETMKKGVEIEKVNAKKRVEAANVLATAKNDLTAGLLLVKEMQDDSSTEEAKE